MSNDDKIYINSVDGEAFEYSPSTELITKDGVVQSREDYEPVFINSTNKEKPPVFSGILMKRLSKILTPSGKINKIINSKMIDL